MSEPFPWSLPVGEANWPRTVTEALACQARLQTAIKLQPLPGKPRTVAGVDAAYDRQGSRIFGAVVIMRLPELEVVEEAGAMGRLEFPYIPGLLTFREAPVIVEAVAQLHQRPDLILVDGQGIAHPRGLGLASHLGLLVGIPTIGVAKSRLVGDPVDLPPVAGAAAPLVWKGRHLGWVWRSRARCRPLYLSPGHLITLEEALAVAQACLGKYRLPLPVRFAHILSGRLRREHSD